MSWLAGAVMTVLVKPLLLAYPDPDKEKMGLLPRSIAGVPRPMACGIVKSKPRVHIPMSEAIRRRIFMCSSRKTSFEMVEYSMLIPIDTSLQRRMWIFTAA